MVRIKPKFDIYTPTLFDSFEMKELPDEKKSELHFISFGSGSSGNCSYIGTDSDGILIDAGVAPDTVKAELHRRGIAMSKIKAIILTHDHADHIRYTYKIIKKNPHIRLYSTPKTLSGIFLRHSLSPRLKDYHRPIFIETPFSIGPFLLTAFQTPHDGTDNVGYMIEYGRHRFAVATDIGHITDRVEYYLSRANYIMLESNYDADMLRNGPYPMYLKARIAAANGHLDNAECASFLARIYTPELKNIFLCHLSDHNNTPEIALEQTRKAMADAGVTCGDASGRYDQRTAPVQLVALPRFKPSSFFVLR